MMASAPGRTCIITKNKSNKPDTHVEKISQSDAQHPQKNEDHGRAVRHPWMPNRTLPVGYWPWRDEYVASSTRSVACAKEPAQCYNEGSYFYYLLTFSQNSGQFVPGRSDRERLGGEERKIVKGKKRAYVPTKLNDWVQECLGGCHSIDALLHSRPPFPREGNRPAQSGNHPTHAPRDVRPSHDATKRRLPKPARLYNRLWALFRPVEYLPTYQTGPRSFGFWEKFCSFAAPRAAPVSNPTSSSDSRRRPSQDLVTRHFQQVS